MWFYTGFLSVTKYGILHATWINFVFRKHKLYGKKEASPTPLLLTAVTF